MWAFSDKELDTKLRTILISEAGKTLLDLDPTLFPVEKLLQLLDKHFYFLLTVEQSPPSSIKNALSPLMKALSAETLLKHSNVDVKLFTASCITEVLRINGPVAPYDDDKMKEVFQLIVSSFEHLDDKSSLSYTKRTSILNTMAKSQVCVLMLDLGYDALLIEMFQHFLKGLRDHHPLKVYTDMEDIMTLALAKSSDIPPGLLLPILHYLKKDDQVPQRSRRLAEQVLINCSSKCKTNLAEAVELSGVSFEKYTDVVALICQMPLTAWKQKKVVAHEKEKAAKVSTPEQTCVPRRRLNENEHEAVSRMREAGVNRQEKRPLEMAEEENLGEAETQTHKRARVESCTLHKAHGEMVKTVGEGEPSCRAHKSSPDPKDSQPCSVTHQLAKVKQSIVDSLTSVRQFSSEMETKEQSIVDTITIVRQFRSELERKEQSIVDTLTSVRLFRSEMKKKEDNLEASLQEVDVLGEKILGINKILNS